MEWDDPTGNGITWPENQPLLEICFKIRGQIGDVSPANLVVNPVPTEIFTITSGTDPISISRSQGSVTVTDCDPDTLKVFISNEVTTHIAREACLKVSAEGFQNIQSFQFSIGWNPNDISYNSVENLSLQGLTAVSYTHLTLPTTPYV